MKSYTWEWKKIEGHSYNINGTSKILSRILSIITNQPSVLGKVLFVVSRVSERNRSNSLERRLESIAFNSTDPDQPSFLVTKTISKNEGKKKKHTWTQKTKLRISKCSSLAGWCFETRLTIQPDSTHPTPLPHRTSRGPNHEMAAWKGANELEFSSVIQLTKKNIIIKQKVIWVKAPGLGVYLFNIDVSRYFWIYIGLCIYYVCISTWTPWARWEWFEFLFKPLRCGSRLGIISLEHRNVLGFEQKISGKLGG